MKKYERGENNETKNGGRLVGAVLKKMLRQCRIRWSPFGDYDVLAKCTATTLSVMTPTHSHIRKTYLLILAVVVFGSSFLPSATAGDLSSHFSKDEFRCKCGCGKVIVSRKLLQKLEQLRNALGNRKIVVTSGYRCPKHNKAVGGVKNSYHLYGMAADIQVEGKTPHEVYLMARSVGLYVIEYKTFNHVDVR